MSDMIKQNPTLIVKKIEKFFIYCEVQSIQLSSEYNITRIRRTQFSRTFSTKSSRMTSILTSKALR